MIKAPILEFLNVEVGANSDLILVNGHPAVSVVEDLASMLGPGCTRVWCRALWIEGLGWVLPPYSNSL